MDVSNQSSVCDEHSDDTMTHSLSKLCEQLQEGVKDRKQKYDSTTVRCFLCMSKAQANGRQASGAIR